MLTSILLITAVLLIVLLSFLIGLPSTIVFLLAYACGLLICYLTINRNYKRAATNVYHSLFIIGGVYLLLCYLYMTYKGYTFLLASDIPGYFLPQTKSFLGDNLFESISAIWKNYKLLGYFKPGFFTYTVFWGYLSQWLGSGLYISLMISTLMLYALSGVVLFRLFTLNNFSTEESTKYSIIVFCFSIVFFYSSQILRDIHILFIYLLAFLCTFKPSSFANIAKMILLTIICATFRIESALFLVIVLLSYTYISSQQENKNRLAIVLLALVILGVGIYYFNDFTKIYDENRAFYVDGISSGSGIIALFQRIPIIGDVLSVIYNFLQPMPCWARMAPPPGTTMYEEYNIMGFPRIFASFFNSVVLITLCVWLFSKNRIIVWNNISKQLKMHIGLGVIFLLLQSAVIDQRRLMPYYCIFFIFFFIIIKSFDFRVKQNLLLYSAVVFLYIQVITFSYLGL